MLVDLRSTLNETTFEDDSAVKSREAALCVFSQFWSHFRRANALFASKHKGSFSRGLLHFLSKGNEASKACLTPCAKAKINIF